MGTNDNTEPFNYTMDIFKHTHASLTEELAERYGKGAFHATALYREIMKYGNRSFSHLPEFRQSKQLADDISRDLVIPVPEITHTVEENGLTKFLCRFRDGLESESVIIPMQNHTTLCISSQIGCRLGCRFCETGSMGFKRNLEVSEMIGQVYCARFVLKKPVKNIVFMGMGEPFDNFDNLKQAIHVLNDQRGFDFAHSHITVSTAGIPKGIQKLGELSWRRINLAVSLNAPNDTIRSSLMPINRKYPLAALKKALLDYPLRKNGSFFIEYVLIRGINDSETHAAQVAEFLSPFNVRINLIPLNKTSGFHSELTVDDDLHRFGNYLEKFGLLVRKRWSKGKSLAAGCGQLGNKMKG